MRVPGADATMDLVDGHTGAVVVVGGAGTIGRAVVQAYGQRGIRVVVIDREPFEQGGDANGTAGVEQVSADITKDTGIARARADVEALGWDIHHLVSLAGGAMDPEFGPLTRTTEATIRDSIELNLTSHILLTRAFVSLLTGESGNMATARSDRSITLVSSINALRDYGLPAYSAAKAGMLGFARAMATELGGNGIRINVVAPGTVVTDATDTTQPKDVERLRRGSALARLAEPDDIAAAVVAASHDLRAMTGQLVVIDCGQTVATPAWRLDTAADQQLVQP